MKLREAVRLVQAASSTRALAGRRVRVVRGTFVAAGLVLLLVLGALFAGSAWSEPMFARVGGVLVAFGALVIWLSWTQGALRRNN